MKKLNVIDVLKNQVKQYNSAVNFLDENAEFRVSVDNVGAVVHCYCHLKSAVDEFLRLSRISPHSGPSLGQAYKALESASINCNKELG